FLCQLPTMPRFGGALVKVLAQPRKAIAAADHLDVELAGGAMFSVVRGILLDELDNAGFHTPPPCPQDDSERGGGFALAIPGVDDHQPFAACLPPQRFLRCLHWVSAHVSLPFIRLRVQATGAAHRYTDRGR